METITALVSACGTIVTTLIALFLLRQGQSDRRGLREDQRREQAKLVTCWCDWNPESPAADYDSPHIPAIFVRNTSQQAVYQVFVDYYEPATSDLVRIGVGPIPPGATRHRDVLSAVPEQAQWEPSTMRARLFFTDAQGAPWMRTATGRLVPDPGPHRDGFSEEGGRLQLGLPRPSTPRPPVAEDPARQTSIG